VVAKGNCGIPQYKDGAIHFHGSPELMAQYALFARDVGATIIGGCCGTTPEHVAAMVNALKTTAPRPFDAQAMIEALGTPWANLPTQDEQSASAGRRRRSQQRDR
jgi:5-methyltetrahydrofolate--homocysteine methyltransferase